MNAGSSGPGVDIATAHADLIYINLASSLPRDSLAADVAAIEEQARLMREPACGSPDV